MLVTLLALVASAALLGGCAVRAGQVVGMVGAGARLPTMVLATGVEGRDCRRAFVVPAEEPSLGRAIEVALASVDEAVVMTDAFIETSALWTGVYNRRCVRVRGSAARLARQLVLPAPPGHHGPAGHGAHH